MAEDSVPSEPLTALVEAATVYHEMHLAFQAAGFTKDESLALVIAVVRAGLNNN